MIEKENTIVQKQITMDYRGKGDFLLGIAFTAFIAVAGTMLASLPGFNRVGAMLSAILIAMIYRNTVGYPQKIREGIQFAARSILRFAIILYGFKLNIQIIFNNAGNLLLNGTITIITAITFTMLISSLIKGEKNLSLLLGVGTGVCGAAAIAAVSPIVKARDEDTAIGVGIIAIVGTIFTLIYTFIQPYLPITSEMYGVWSGLSLHEIAHVAAATAPVGSDTLAVGLMSKLGRVFLLIPLSFILSFWMRRKERESGQVNTPIPWFLVGFIITSIIGSYLPISGEILNDISYSASFLLAMGMVGLGLNIDFSSLRKLALRPLIAMFIASIAVSLLTYITL